MRTIAVGALALAACSPPDEHPTSVAVAAETRALVTLPPSGSVPLAVSTPAFNNGADIPFENTQYDGNVFPGLGWTAGPAGTQSYAVIMQDVDGHARGTTNPILHWTMGNIPAAITRLAPDMAAPPDGAVFGPNGRGTNQPYLGPRTPPGPRHRYHFQVFALDRVLPADAFATYEALTGAMKGHVVASGEVVGLGRAK